jgi:hypothetical protein
VPQLLTYLDTTPTGSTTQDAATVPRDGLEPDFDPDFDSAEHDPAALDPFDEPEA